MRRVTSTIVTLSVLFMLYVNVSIGEEASSYDVPDPALQLTLIDESAQESFLSVHVDSEGRLFAGGREAVFAYDPDGKGGFKPVVELYRFPPHTWVYDITTRGNDLYVQTTTVTYLLPGARIKREGITVKPLLWGLPAGSALHVTYGVHQGMHGLAWGPEGDLYISFGDAVWDGGSMPSPTRWGHSFFYTADGKKIPFNGVGGIIRMKPDGTNVRTVATGLRNPCGLAFDRNWNLFTHDNDHESMPVEFIPGRLLHVTDGADFSWPRGWMVTKSPDRKDLLRTMFTGMGRTVPVGQSYYDESLLPAKYRDNILLARWGQKTLTAYPKWADGATFQAREQILISGRQAARPVGVTVGPDGRIFVASCFMGGNEPSPIYRSELLVLSTKTPPAAATATLDPVATDVDTLYRLLGNPSWRLRQTAHVELLRRGGPALDVAVANVGKVTADIASDEVPAIQQQIHLAAASKSDAALPVLQALSKHRDLRIRLAAIRALSEQFSQKVPSAWFVELLKDDSPAIQLVALQALFHFDELPPEVITGPGRSNDTYLRQTATRLMAAKLSADELAKLRQSNETGIRLAVVLAAGRQATTPPTDFIPPAEIPLGGSLGPGIHLDREVVDLRKVDRIGHFSLSAYWKLVGASLRPQFDLLMESLNDDDETVRLQAAYFLSLLNDERSRPAIAKVRAEATAGRLAAAQPVPVTQLWMCGPFSDVTAGQAALKSFDKRHPPEVGAIDVAANYAAGDGKVGWRKLSAENGDYSSQVTPLTSHYSTYAMFVIESPTRQRAWLELNAEGDGIVWQNGRSVWHRAQGGTSTTARDRVVLDLASGGNQILIRFQPGPQRTLALSLRTLGRIALQVPEAQDISLADRLKAGAQSSENLADFLKVDWNVAAKQGNAANGRKLFTTIGCAKCHAVGSSLGVTGGPSLQDVGRRFTPDYIVESVLLPSKKISEFFRSSTIITEDGRVLTGLITAENDTEIELLKSDATRLTILKADIEERTESPVSAMPAGLVKTPEELQDVMTYLLGPQ